MRSGEAEDQRQSSLRDGCGAQEFNPQRYAASFSARIHNVSLREQVAK